MAHRLPGAHFFAISRVHRGAERIFRREIDDVLRYYSDSELHQTYRFSRQTIRYITSLIEDKINPTTNRTQPVSATKQVLITLRFLAAGSFQQVTGDMVCCCLCCPFLETLRVFKVPLDTRRMRFHKASSVRDRQFSMCNRCH